MKKSAFTLVEVMVLGLAGLLLFVGVIRIMSSGVKKSKHGVQKLKSLQTLALFLENLQRDVDNATTMKCTQTDRIKFSTSSFTKATLKKVFFEATYEVIEKGGKISHLLYTPKPLYGGTLPKFIRKKKYFKKQLKSISFKELKKHLSIVLPEERSGFRIAMEFYDRSTGARLKFQRSFYPPILKGNNQEDGFKPVRGF
ncbi:PilW family protein [Candidatus Riflebacteria bacterium]